MKGRIGRTALLGLAAAVLAVTPAAAAGKGATGKLGKIRHFVVVYQENHSFDNLWGGWTGVDGLGNADAAHSTQVDQAGAPYQCLLQNDVNLTPPPAPGDCAGHTTPAFTSHFPNARS